jgi:hypothetical protein
MHQIQTINMKSRKCNYLYEIMLVATCNHQGSLEDSKTMLVHSSIDLAKYPHFEIM